MNRAARRRYGHAEIGTKPAHLTPAQVNALRFLVDAPGGAGSSNARHGLTLPVARVLADKGLVKLKIEGTTYMARRSFGRGGAGDLRSGIFWLATITDAGRAAVAS